MPGRKQGFGDSLELGKVVAGIDGSCLSLNGELATESAIHVLNAMLQNVKHLQREARPVSRKVPPACVAGFTHAIGLPEAAAATAGAPIGNVDAGRSDNSSCDLRMADKLS